MEQNDFSHLSDELSTRELAEVMAAARAAGMVAQMTIVDDPDSPEGRQAVEYVNSHHWLPRNYRTLPRSEVEALGKKLNDPAGDILDKKKALMLLGHRGSIEAYRILKTYAQSAPAELLVWSKMAFDECKTFLATELSEETQLGFNIILQKTGRNALCPCGSGKKYKRCCGAVV